VAAWSLLTKSSPPNAGVGHHFLGALRTDAVLFLGYMIYRAFADLVLVAHFAFALFTVLGGLLVFRWRSLLLVHLAAVCWAVILQWANWTCPLTPLENYLREMGGETRYREGFVEHYVSLVLYPENLTIELRYLLGILLIMVNLIIYGCLMWRK
jgi:hypothetical protein